MDGVGSDVEWLEPSYHKLADALLDASNPIEVRQVVEQYPEILQEETFQGIVLFVDAIEQDSQDAAARALRLRLHEVERLRHFQQNVLQPSKDLINASWTHAYYYTDLVEQTSSADYLLLDEHIPNILVALRWTTDNEPFLQARLLSAAFQFLLMRGYTALLESYLPQAIEVSANNRILQANLLECFGDLERRQGNVEGAHFYYEGASQRYREEGEWLGLKLSHDDREGKVVLNAETWRALQTLQRFWYADWNTCRQMLEEYKDLLLSESVESLFGLCGKIFEKRTGSVPEAASIVEQLRAQLHYCRIWGAEVGWFFIACMHMADVIDIPAEYEDVIKQSATLLAQQQEESTVQSIAIMQVLLDRLTANTPALFEAALLCDLATALASLPATHPLRSNEQIAAYYREALPIYQAAERQSVLEFIQSSLAGIDGLL